MCDRKKSCCSKVEADAASKCTSAVQEVSVVCECKLVFSSGEKLQNSLFANVQQSVEFIVLQDTFQILPSTSRKICRFLDSEICCLVGVLVDTETVSRM